jgi:hypothetical protein
MYGLTVYEVWRQRPDEIRQEVAVYRLQELAHADRGRESGLVRDLSWELSRYAGLLGKRLRNSR